MQDEVLQRIKEQVTQNDDKIITEIYYKNKENFIDTVLELLCIAKKKQKPLGLRNPEFNDIRTILDSKDIVFNNRHKCV